jgi:hypothetical protein
MPATTIHLLSELLDANSFSDLTQGPSVIDLSRYVPPTRHRFETRYISKAKAEAEIDAICKDGYRMTWFWIIWFVQ